MEKRLTDSSSDDDTPVNEVDGFKRKADYAFDGTSEEEPASKISRRDSSYDGSYYSKESEDEAKDDPSFETRNFYDNSFPNEKSDDESEVKSQSSYYNDGNLSDHTDNFNKTQSESSSDEKVTKQKSKTSESENEPKFKTNVMQMMQKMGYKEGHGLGKKLQGRVQPVEASTQKGRRGLGLQLKELERAQIEFDPEKEVVEIVEKITWLDNSYEHLPLDEEITQWENDRLIGTRKETIDGETTFCDEFIVKSVIDSKSVFDRLDKREMQEARTRSNPFETIRGAIFQNRAAVKMANIDTACQFMFTNPPTLQPNELLYFADVCAGPGGFSEYVLWRKKWRSKGFGFTLKRENDFKLHDFYAGPCETFHPYYGVDDTGDVYEPKNQLALRDLIMQQTNNQGVHFMMADGGFSVEGQENIQEILSKQLYLCQCLVALMIVRVGGHFVTKLFDLFTPFSAGLVYIMYRCFNEVSIFKPNTSRPANSERYLICKGKKPDIDYITNYLFRTNEKLLKTNKTNDILELVPLDKLTSDEKFFNYLKESNEELGKNQVVGLKKIAYYTENKNLFEPRQKSMREKCLQYWGVPDEPRSLPPKMAPTTKVTQLLGNSLPVLEKSSLKNAFKLSKENVGKFFAHEQDWYCMPCSSGEGVTGKCEDSTPTFYLGMGRSQVYKFTEGHWKLATETLIELPRDTIVYAEMIAELRNEERSQTKTYGLHILDAYTLGQENVSHKYITERWELIALFCKSLWKPVERNFVPVRAKEWFTVSENLSNKLKIETKVMKNKSRVPAHFPKRHSHENENNKEYYFIPRSIIFFKSLEDPWAKHYSNKVQQRYFFNTHDGKSIWEHDIHKLPISAKTSFAKAIQTRVIWNWPDNRLLTMEDLINFLRQKHMPPK